MRVSSIIPQLHRADYTSKVQKNRIEEAQEIKFDNKINNLTTKGNALITFTGFAEPKNMNDIASLAPESNYFKKIPEMCQGGLGVVALEGPASFVKHEGKRVYGFYGIFNHDNPKGAHKFLYHPKSDFPNGLDNLSGKNIVNEFVDEKYFYTAKPGQTLEEFAKEKGFNVEDLDYVIQSKPQEKALEFLPDGTAIAKDKRVKTTCSPYIILKPTTAKGAFERLSENSIDEFKTVNYELFEARLPGGKTDSNFRQFFISTQNLAKRAKPYSYDDKGGGGYLAELTNTEMDRAYTKLMPQLNTKEFNHFNPASHWLHCRPTFLTLNYIANESAFGNKYWNGTKTHATFHNPGRDYQGHTPNPLEFFRYVAEKEDIEKLKKQPIYKTIKEIDEKGWYHYESIARNHPESVEAKKLKETRKVLNSFLSGFIDGTADGGLYNITMTPVNAATRNPHNMTAGTVSMNYGWEMKNKDMYQIADGLTHKLAALKTIDITNGSTPANLGIDNPDAGFGRGGNILTAKKEGFSTYNKEMPLDEIVTRKKSNTKWFLDIMAEASGNGKLNEVFFNSSQLSSGYNVIGELSAYKEGDILLMGWGRPDSQKGFPTSLEGLLEFLKSNAPEEMKSRVKVITGSGDGLWNRNDPKCDIHKMENILKQIQELDGGKYAKNACIVDGFFPNRLVACATFGYFTSTFEPCGITPLESFAAGTPSISVRTGGAPNFIAKTRGFLTKDAYLMNPEFYGLSWAEGMDVVNDTRRERSAKQIAQCIREAAETHGTTGENQAFKDMIKDAINQKVDWHENSAYNNGVSANKRYMNEVWEIDKGWKARNQKPMNRLVGEFIEMVKNPEQAMKNAKNRWAKVAAFAGISLVAAGSGLYLYFKQKSPTVNNDASTTSDTAATQQQVAATPENQSEVKEQTTSLPLVASAQPSEETNLLKKLKTA